MHYILKYTTNRDILLPKSGHKNVGENDRTFSLDIY